MKNNQYFVIEKKSFNDHKIMVKCLKDDGKIENIFIRLTKKIPDQIFNSGNLLSLQFERNKITEYHVNNYLSIDDFNYNIIITFLLEVISNLDFEANVFELVTRFFYQDFTTLSIFSFLINLINSSGFAINLNSCIKCESKIVHGLDLEGGFICNKDFGVNSYSFNRESLQFFYFQKIVNYSMIDFNKVFIYLIKYLEFHLTKNFKYQKLFLDAMEEINNEKI